MYPAMQLSTALKKKTNLLDTQSSFFFLTYGDVCKWGHQLLGPSYGAGEGEEVRDWESEGKRKGGWKVTEKV